MREGRRRRRKGGRVAQEVRTPGDWMLLSFPTDRPELPLSGAVVLVGRVSRLPLAQDQTQQAIRSWVQEPVIRLRSNNSSNGQDEAPRKSWSLHCQSHHRGQIPFALAV